MNEKIASLANNSVDKKMMHQIYEICDIKKASEDERQNQTTTTKINYVKKFMSVLENKT